MKYTLVYHTKITMRHFTESIVQLCIIFEKKKSLLMNPNLHVARRHERQKAQSS